MDKSKVARFLLAHPVYGYSKATVYGDSLPAKYRTNALFGCIGLISKSSTKFSERT